MRKLILLILGLALVVTGCESSYNQAKAEKKRAEASVIRAKAEATQVAIAHQEAVNADDLAVREATREDRVVARRNLIWWGMVLLVAAGAVTWAGYSYVILAGARAVAGRVTLTSKLVHLNPRTRTWPMLLDTKNGLLIDLETGERGRLADVRQLDHRRLLVSARVREAGVFAQAAVDIARATRDAQPGDMLPGVAASVPVLDGGK